MAISLYQATVPHYLQILPGVLANIDKAESWAKEQGLSEQDMLSKRLAPDMWPLAIQLRQASGHSAGAIRGTIDGVFRPDVSEAPQDFATLRAIVADALAYVQSLDAAQVDALEDKDVGFEFGGEVRMRFTGADFLLSFSLPNFYFHVNAAYSILRNLGVAVGKRDYLGAPRIKLPA